MKTIELEEIDSTNEFCKRIDDGDDIIVTAQRQLAGKGTKGRCFVSERGGLYVSVMRHYREYDSSKTFKIMVNACVAVCKTVEKYGLKPVIRWANDVLVNGKKICGTLIENTFCGSHITRSIVGIGLNINNALPQELDDIAISMKIVLGHEISVNEVKDYLVAALQKDYLVEDYKNYIDWLGKMVTLKTERSTVLAKALDIDDSGRLVCYIDGSLRKISAAEMSLRL